MKPKLYPILFLAVLSMMAVACKTASKLYQKGQYDEAVELAAKKLQKDPDDPKLLDIIQNSYRYAVEDHESAIRANSESNNELKWEWMYNEYTSLQKMYDAIRKVPQVYEIVHPTDYSSYLVTYAEKAGEVRFDRGLSLMQKGDKQSYRDAYHELQAAIAFEPGQRDIQEKLDEAWDYAVTNVVILPMEQSGYQYSSYTTSGVMNLDEKLLRDLQYNSGNEFVRYYSSGVAQSNNIRADQVVDLRLSDLDLGRYYDERSTKKVSKDVVVKETVYSKDSVVREYGKVTAQVTTTRRTLNSQAVIQVSVRDEDGRWLWNDNYTSTYNWSTQFATYTGDARALDDNDKQLVNRKADAVPFDSDIIRCLMNDLDNSVLSGIRNYGNRL